MPVTAIQETPAASAELRTARVHMIWTRPIDGVPMAGRTNNARRIRHDLRDTGFVVSESTLRPLTNAISLRRIVAAGSRLLASLLARRPLPLQCLLFSDRDEIMRVLSEIPRECELVYLDGVRCLRTAEVLRQAKPDLPILTDLDDLMSRRMQVLIELGEPPSAGYLAPQLPRLLARVIASRSLSRLLLRYEAWALRSAEDRMGRTCEAIVLISSIDAAALEARAKEVAIRSIPMSVEPAADAHREIKPPYRFVFIGSDTLKQNQLTIDTLLDLWRRERLATPLCIYGHQQRSHDLPAGVSMPGYADSLADVYDGHSILLSPSFVAGGLKTKVIEAFALGAPVAGNRTTFEGMALPPDYPLLFETTADLVSFLQDPERMAPHLQRSIQAGDDYVRRWHNPERVRISWGDVARTAIEMRLPQAQTLQ